MRDFVALSGFIQFCGHVWCVVHCPGYERENPLLIAASGLASIALGMALPVVAVACLKRLERSDA